MLQLAPSRATLHPAFAWWAARPGWRETCKVPTIFLTNQHQSMGSDPNSEPKPANQSFAMLPLAPSRATLHLLFAWLAAKPGGVGRVRSQPSSSPNDVCRWQRAYKQSPMRNGPIRSSPAAKTLCTCLVHARLQDLSYIQAKPRMALLVRYPLMASGRTYASKPANSSAWLTMGCKTCGLHADGA